MAVRFADQTSDEIRSLQAYLILIGYAHMKKTMSYLDLATLMGYKSGQVVGPMLNHIKGWCAANGFPPLHELVVSKETGVPGKGLEPSGNWEEKQDNIFSFDWFALVPPTPAELDAAYTSHRNSATSSGT